MKCKLCDCNIFVIIDKTFVKCPISEGPFYKSLCKQDEKIYEDYIRCLGKVCPSTIGLELDYRGFLQLYNSFKESGFYFDPEDPIVISDLLEIHNGQRRVSILFFLCGKDTILDIVDGCVKNVEVRNGENHEALL